MIRCLFSKLSAVLFFMFLLSGLMSASILASDMPKEEIDISLRDAELHATLASFASIGGAELDIAENVSGTVTVELTEVPWGEAVAIICQQQNLACHWQEAAPQADGSMASPKLLVDPATGFSGLATDLSLSLRQAPLDVLVQGIELVGDRPVKSLGSFDQKVSLELTKAPWPAAMDYLCQVGGCQLVWSADRLRVEPAETMPQQTTFNMSLAGAPTRSVVESMREVHGLRQLQSLEIDIDDDVAKTVDLDLEKVDWAIALDRLCEEAGCRWTLTWGDSRRGVAHRLHLKDRDSRLDASFVAPSGKLTRGALARALAESHGLDLELDKTLDPQVPLASLDAGVTWESAVKHLCKSGCRWRLEGDTLVVASVARTAMTHPASAHKGQRVRAELSQGERKIEAEVELSWARPQHRAVLGDWQSTLSWIPFSSDLHAIVPTLTYCGAEDLQESVHVLDAVRLPLSEFSVRELSTADDPTSRAASGEVPLTLRLAPVVELSDETSSETPAVQISAAVCARHINAAARSIQVQLTDHSRGDGGFDLLPASTRLWNEKSGYLLLTLPGSKDQPSAAVLLAGVRKGLPVLVVVEEIDGALDVRTLELADSYEQRLAADGGRYGLTLRFGGA